MQLTANPLVVVAVALVGPDGRCLVQRRTAQAQHGGLWEFPGGKVDAGETPEAAAVRELHEELDIAVDPGALEAVTFASGFTASTPARALVLLLYLCRSWKGEPRALDADALAWHEVEEIGQLSMPPLDYPLAKALMHRLKP